MPSQRITILMNPDQRVVLTVLDLLGETTTSNHKSMRHWNVFEPVIMVLNTIQHIQLTYIHAIAPGKMHFIG